MSTKIKGDSNILYIYDGSDYAPIMCLTSNTLSESRNIIESQTKCDPGEIKKLSGSYTYTIDFEGEMVEYDNGNKSWEYLHQQLMITGTEVDWKIDTADPNNNESRDFYGTAILSELSLDASAGDELVTFSGTLEGSGLISITDPHD